MKRRHGRLCWLGCLLLLVLAGCELFTDPEDQDPDSRTRWSLHTGATSQAEPYSDGDLAVFTIDPDRIIGLDATDGELRWERRLPLPPEASFGLPLANILAFGDLILVPAYDLFALDRDTGREVWRFSPPEVFPAFGRAALADGKIYTVGHLLHCLDAETGSPIWTADLGERPFAPVVDGGVVYVGTRKNFEGALGAGHVVALDAASGEVLWKYPIPDAPPPEPYLGGVAGPGALTEELIIVASTNARVYALERKTGELRWRYHALEPTDAGVVVIDGVAITGGDAGIVEGIDVATGEGLWLTPVRESSIGNTITLGDGVALVNNDVLYAIDAAGNIRWKDIIEGIDAHSTPAMYHEGIVYIGGYKSVRALKAGG